MKAVNRRTVQTGPSTACQQHLLVLVAALFAGCGGRGLHVTDGAVAAGAGGEGGGTDLGGAMTSGGNAQGGGGVASGGQTGEGGNTDLGGAMAGGSGGVGFIVRLSAGGVTSLGGIASFGQDGGESPDDLCEYSSALIFEAIGMYLAGIGSCMPRPDGGTSWGNIVIDSQGQVIDITRSGVSKTEPVEALAGLRWPCLAGQTIPYFCQIGE